MRISKLDVFALYLPFRFRFTHAAAARDANHSIFIRLEDRNGNVGYGEAIPRSYLTGEDIDSVFIALKKFWDSWLSGLLIDQGSNLQQTLGIRWLESDAQNNLAAFGAIDLALHDLWYKNKNPSAIKSESISGNRADVCTIPLISKYAMLGVIRLARVAGFRKFKFKLSSPDQVRLIADACKHLGPAALTVVDANAALTYGDAVQVALDLKKMGVNVFEQPIASYLYEELAAIEQQSGLPIMLDESLCSLEQARLAVKFGAGGIWNIRLAKNGGIAGASELMRLAKNHGRQIYNGCLVGETHLLAQAQQFFGKINDDILATEAGFARLLLRRDPMRHYNFGVPGHGGPDLKRQPTMQRQATFLEKN